MSFFYKQINKHTDKQAKPKLLQIKSLSHNYYGRIYSAFQTANDTGSTGGQSGVLGILIATLLPPHPAPRKSPGTETGEHGFGFLCRDVRGSSFVHGVQVQGKEER